MRLVSPPVEEEPVSELVAKTEQALLELCARLERLIGDPPPPPREREPLRLVA